MKTKKVLSLFLSLVMILSSCVLFASAENENSLKLEDGIDALRGQFEYGVGPETDGYAIDYRYYSPAGENDSTKYPLVVWLHGMGDGAYDGRQVERSNIAYWTSEEFQSRFEGSEGAYILAARSLEEEGLYWTDSLIHPLRAAIDDFIAKNSENIDVRRIYIGGYSMGGKMTLKMAVAYPEMFAAAFPICPAWVPGTDATALLADMPVWLTSGAADPLVNYFTWVMPTWKNIVSQSNVAEACRFSTLSLTLYPNGLPTSSSHHSWFAVNYDMFSSRNGKYPLMRTVDGADNKVKLTYPEGMISWLSGFESDFDGAAATDGGNSEVSSNGAQSGIKIVCEFFKNFFEYIFSFFKIG